MAHDDLTQSFDTNTAWMLQDLFETTAHPAESTAAAARARCSAIVGMFRAFEAGDAREAMIACHCIQLRFVLAAAMADAGNPEQDPQTLTRTRASATSLSKSLFQWMGKYDSMKAVREARQAEIGATASDAKAPAVEPLPVAEPEPRMSTPLPLAARPPNMVMPGAVAPNADPNAEIEALTAMLVRAAAPNGAVPVPG